jgi:hypothetical protein
MDPLLQAAQNEGASPALLQILRKVLIASECCCCATGATAAAGPLPGDALLFFGAGAASTSNLDATVLPPGFTVGPGPATDAPDPGILLDRDGTISTFSVSQVGNDAVEAGSQFATYSLLVDDVVVMTSPAPVDVTITYEAGFTFPSISVLRGQKVSTLMSLTNEATPGPLNMLLSATLHA